MNDPEPSHSPQSAASLCSKLQGLDKVVVAIHGIGSQTRSSTIREVVTQFGNRQTRKLPLLPLGYFYFDPGVTTVVSRISDDPENPLYRIGFVEVFWADVPDGVVKTNDTLEETKAWGKTIVSRAQNIYEKAQNRTGPTLVTEDFDLAAGVVEEIVEAMAVLENLCTLADKAGIFKFDLASLLRDYVDDVQVVTEFEPFRRKILLCFHKTMAGIEQTFRDCKQPVPEIHIVAHSEGTVVSFLGLLEALAGLPIANPQAGPGQSSLVSTAWISRVRGYMTIGSPIDKHLVLWPRIWDQVRGKLNLSQLPSATDPGQRIKWRNYYDFGDPIGFELDTAREFLRDEKCTVFDFDGAKDDFGFGRYFLPGKAHNDYWTDSSVFGHFIDDVVVPTQAPPTPPQSRNWPRLVSNCLPYAIVYLLHVLAVYALFKGVSGFFDPPPPLANVAPQILALAAFFCSVTVAARLPRLSKALAPRLRSLITLVIVGLVFIPTLGSVAGYVGHSIAPLVQSAASTVVIGQLAIVVTGAIAVLTGWRAPRRPRWGRRLLLGIGGLLVLLVVSFDLVKGSAAGKSLWPAILGAAGFMYLWWLAILMFDLTFIWHRYVRQAIAIRALRSWSKKKPPPTRDAEPIPAGVPRGVTS